MSKEVINKLRYFGLTCQSILKLYFQDVNKNYGFNLVGDDLIRAVKENTGGFTTVLDGLKAYLEFDLKLNLIADKFPKGK